MVVDILVAIVTGYIVYKQESIERLQKELLIKVLNLEKLMPKR